MNHTRKYKNNYSNHNDYTNGNWSNNYQNFKRNNPYASIKNTEYYRQNKEENKQIYGKEYNNFGENQINNSQKYYSSKGNSEEELIDKKSYDALKKEKENIKAELENKKSEYEKIIKKLKTDYEEKIKSKENLYTKELDKKEEENKVLKIYLKEEKEKVQEKMYNEKLTNNLNNQLKEKDSEIEQLKINYKKLTNNLNNQLKQKDSEIEQLKIIYKKICDELNTVKYEHNQCSKEIDELKESNSNLLKEKSELINSLQEEKNKNLVSANSLKNKEKEILFYKKKFKIIKDVILDKENEIEIKKTNKDMCIESKEEVEEEEEEEEEKEEEVKFEYNKNNGKVGINNEELNCYMSSVLQILKNLRDFAKLILKSNKNNDNILVSLKNLIKSLYYSKEKSVSLIEFKNDFSKIYKKFEGSKDNDSTFFLIYLFQHLQKIFLKPKRPVTDISEFSFLNLNFDEKQELIKFLDSYEPKNYSDIHDLFFGYQMSEIICSGCNKREISFQSFNILHLSLYDEITKLTSLEQCINSFLFTKDKKGSDNFNCSNCSRKCLSHVISIVKLPPILIINLKRVGEKYVYDHDITIPSILKTKTIEKLEKFDMEYELIGFIKHLGSEKSGHNIAYSKNIFDNKWYRFDDTDVEVINRNISTNGSFLLFYQLKK